MVVTDGRRWVVVAGVWLFAIGGRDSLAPAHDASSRDGAATGRLVREAALSVNASHGEDGVVDTLPGTVYTGRFEHPLGARDWRVYVPASGAGAPRPVLVFLHGCTQDAADIVRGARLERHAEQAGMLLVVPEQPATANPQRCWNWFAPLHQAPVGGEVELLMALLDAVAPAHGGDMARVHIGGMSAGGAMAALVASAHPSRFVSLSVVAGVPVGAASSVADAVAAMRDGPLPGRVTADVLQRRSPEDARPLPLFLMHGARDAVVAPANADAFEAQWRAWLQARGVDRPQRSETRDDLNGSVVVTRTERDAAGRPWLMSVRLAEVGHAWPGGDPSGSWTDAAAPDGSVRLFAFLREVGAP